ncbi:MAG: S-adenosylmethionine tRNA ribosyltransferase [Bacteroidetes bacterium HGW-Bacteroidetes-17]|jgi:S-adenosylmethionine:tRNA ribosyltransferase-isomerase|nr:MAG: S-adenosylmethionine tRNA ribosyltransferase [Bacteroidetes bacterium HGW-Bacteroidetes-17]
MNLPDKILMNDFDYLLPQERIAKFPVVQRDQSKLLINKQGVIHKDLFCNIVQYLPGNSLVLFNETKVIQARLQFRRESGGKIEIFCLEPKQPTSEIQLAFQQSSPVVWKCLIGNAKRWKEGSMKKRIKIDQQEVEFFAKKIGKEGEAYLVEFSWYPSLFNFSQLLEFTGLVPLPPYLNRDAEKEDKERYQTIYAQYDGSVAAPTAGLHFTDEVFEMLKEKNIQSDKVILHVGAGTFKPVSTDSIEAHEMHTEKIIIQKSTIEKLIEKQGEKIIVVGTTTLRTLESLYWFGAKLMINELSVFSILQWDPYQEKYRLENTITEVLERIVEYMDQNDLSELHGETQLMIAPGYQFKIADILITNFHQPKSTLLLLVSAFIGDDWKKAYQYAMDNEFRFLSYGDSCLFFREK